MLSPVSVGVLSPVSVGVLSPVSVGVLSPVLVDGFESVVGAPGVRDNHLPVNSVNTAFMKFLNQVLASVVTE